MSGQNDGEEPQGYGHLGFEDLEKNEDDGGGWLATYADMMTLLMCFFIMILSFSNMDELKFGRMAGSVEEAFGVQNSQEFSGIPMGTSIIADHFSPGKTELTIFESIFQVTDQYRENQLKVTRGEQNLWVSPSQKKALKLDQHRGQQAEDTVQQAIEQVLDTHPLADNVNVFWEAERLTIRILEQGAFDSGSDHIKPMYLDLLDEIGSVLQNTEGDIAIEGHTDSRPIHTARFRSNFELSSARAVSVAQILMAQNGLNSQRLRVVGFAGGKPIASNENAAGRALNRRVEIIWQPDNPRANDRPVMNSGSGLPNKTLSVEPDYPFELAPEEIF